MTPSLPTTPPFSIDQPFMVQRWTDAIFINWPVPATAVANLIPAPLEPDLYEGTAWVSLVPFRMRDLRIRHLPPIPGTANFGEVNVRTYVQGPDGPGVWFCSLDVHAALATFVARTFYRLPYYHGTVREATEGKRTSWTVKRQGSRHIQGELTVNRLEEQVNTALSTFLTARWRLYSGSTKRLRRARVDHPEWPLRAAVLETCNTGLVESAGFDVAGITPTVYWSAGVPVKVTAPQRTS